MTFERILSYTLNSITKKIVQVLFLVVGLIMTGHAILTPLLMVLIMITGDFLGMALTTDNVRPSAAAECVANRQFDDCRRGSGICELIFCTSVLAFGAYRLGFEIGTLQTLAFVVIVFGNQATTYNNRERRHLWSSRPSFWLIVSSIADLSIASVLAVGGIAMTPLAPLVVVGTLAAAIAFAVILDFVKTPIFGRLKFSSPLSRNLLIPISLPPARPSIVHGWNTSGQLKFALLLLGLAMAAGSGGYELWEQFKAALPIGTALGNGRIEANEIDIDTRSPGRVADLLVDEGAVVTAGQILAHIDTKDFDALLKRDEAHMLDLQTEIKEGPLQIAGTMMRLKQAKQHFERTSMLLRKGRATSEMLNQRRQAMNRAIADLTAAKAKLDEARVQP